MNYFGLYIGDYARSTGGLSITEHGAYFLLLSNFYGTGRPLPKDKAEIYHMIRANTKEERKAADKVLARYWRPLTDDFMALCGMLDFVTAEERNALGSVMAEWGSDAVGGYVNLRALSEMAKAHTRTKKTKEAALQREAKKRLERAASGRKGGEE